MPKKPKEIKSKEQREIAYNIDTDYDTIILLEPNSKFELKARSGTIECYDYINKKTAKLKFSNKSSLYKLLSGYSMIKDIYKKSRLIAVEIDSKNNVSVLEDNRLKQAEKKFKKHMKDWRILFRGSLGI